MGETGKRSLKGKGLEPENGGGELAPDFDSRFGGIEVTWTVAGEWREYWLCNVERMRRTQ